MSQIEQFNNIYLQYYDKTFRFARLYVRNDQVAEDIATESLIKLWETMKKEQVEKPLALLLTILKHKSLDLKGFFPVNGLQVGSKQMIRVGPVVGGVIQRVIEWIQEQM